MSADRAVEIQSFKEKVSTGDGVLIPLRKTTKDGRQLFIAAGHLSNPSSIEGVDEAVNPEFFSWTDERMPTTAVMLVDIYAEQDSYVVPMGHMDWWLMEDYANGGGNMHEARLPRTDPEHLARERWHKYDHTAFKVEYGYHGQGLGTLLLATSAVALPAIGARKFYTGVLLLPGKKTYARFDVKDKDFKGASWKDRHLPIERLSEHPRVNQTIAEFI